GRDPHQGAQVPGRARSAGAGHRDEPGGGGVLRAARIREVPRGKGPQAVLRGVRRRLPQGGEDGRALSARPSLSRAHGEDARRSEGGEKGLLARAGAGRGPRGSPARAAPDGRQRLITAAARSADAPCVAAACRRAQPTLAWVENSRSAGMAAGRAISESSRRRKRNTFGIAPTLPPPKTRNLPVCRMRKKPASTATFSMSGRAQDL